jgi:nucleoside-diphosphate-sugar epimerase
MMNKGLFVLPNGGRGMLDPTWVGNLIDAFFALIETDATGETFNVTDGLTITTADYFSYLARIAGVDHVRTLPGPLVRAVAKCIRPFAQWFDLDDSPEPAAVDFLSKPHGYSVRKLRNTIDTRPSVDLEEGMEIIEDWALTAGLAPTKRPRTP